MKKPNIVQLGEILCLPHCAIPRQNTSDTTLHTNDLVLEVLVRFLMKATSPLSLKAAEATHYALVSSVCDVSLCKKLMRIKQKDAT